ncbi:MAG: DUF2911 domain-containing protein [Bacteroidota bacterium]
MIKSTITLATLLLLFVVAVPALQAQERGNDSSRVSPNAAVEQTIGTTQVRVTYGRPSVRGREIFSANGLVPYGEVWRAGANESTNITVSDPVSIAGQTLPEGTWSLYTIPGESEWTVILNRKLSWGTEYDESEDLFRVTVTPERTDHQEQFLITFEEISEEDAQLVLQWEDVRIPVPMTVSGS